MAVNAVKEWRRQKPENKPPLDDAAERLADLTPRQISHLMELADELLGADAKDRLEIAKTIVEVVFGKQLNLGAAEDLDNAVNDEAKSRVANYRRKVGVAIRNRRVKLNMTQQQLAKLAGIPQSHVSRLEVGKHAPTHLTMERVAKALRTRASKLDPGFDD